MSTDARRLSAYADLVAAVLDLRSSAAREAFDEALATARDSGEIADNLARQLRWLQRQSERALVEHAESVLPAAMVAQNNSITTHVSTAPGIGNTQNTLYDELARPHLPDPLQVIPADVGSQHFG